MTMIMMTQILDVSSITGGEIVISILTLVLVIVTFLIVLVTITPFFSNSADFIIK